MLKKNDRVIYPGHGVAVVEDIIEKSVAGTTIPFIKLNFLFKDMTILVPTYNADMVGIRNPCTGPEAQDIIAELTRKPTKLLHSFDFTPSGWNKRNKDYQEKIQQGKIMDMTQTYRDLMNIAQQKDLSFGERNVLAVLEELVCQELQIVLNKDKDEVLQIIRGPFKQYIFHSAENFTPETPVTL